MGGGGRGRGWAEMACRPAPLLSHLEGGVRGGEGGKEERGRSKQCGHMHIVFTLLSFLYLRSAVEASLDMKKVPQERYTRYS
jgi:hypothetical protein